MTAKAIADYIQGLTIGQGRYVGQSFKLLGWQKRFLAGAFGATGRRRYQSGTRRRQEHVLFGHRVCAAAPQNLRTIRSYS